VRTLAVTGVPCERYGSMEQDELGIWSHGGGKVARFKDPDGNTLALTQVPA
jgi:predicted enzyme related to lactoylglutathione lyase